MTPESVRFAGNDLSLIQGVSLYNHEFNNLPLRELKTYKLARRDKSITTSSEYSTKTIPVYLDICSGSRADTEDTLTFLKSLLQPQNASLAVLQGGVETEYTATMNEVNISWLGSRCIVVIVFLASDPIGKEVEVQTFASIPSITTSSAAQAITVNGSATAYPVITVNITAVTGGANKAVTVSNGLTNQGITITRTWAAADVLQIDSENLEATVNGALVDFTGMFPQFPAGSQQITYMDEFTTRTVSLSASYQPRLV